MLSILLPIYAYDVRTFVRQLHLQASQLSVDWEIILVDDASPAPWNDINKELKSIPNLHFYQLPKNIGRAQIRNHLATLAQYPYLLFLDCDGFIERTDFLSKYVQYLKENTVIYGGRTYSQNPPPVADLWLHWHYGHQRETPSAAIRSKTPYHGFMTNNFCVPKELFIQIPLEEKLLQYGHEDTLFGYMLQQQQIPILHIDNPVRHDGLESSSVWFDKQEKAIQNLYSLQKQYPQIQTRALKAWRLLHKVGFMFILQPLLSRLSPYFKKQLMQNTNTSFLLLDGLKLRWLENAHRNSVNVFAK